MGLKFCEQRYELTHDKKRKTFVKKKFKEMRLRSLDVDSFVGSILEQQKEEEKIAA